MERRDFLLGMLTTSTLASIGCQAAGGGATAGARRGVSMPSANASRSATAFRRLLETLEELERDWLHAPGRIESPFDEPDGYRNLLSMLEAGLVRYREADPEWPVFERLVTPTRKFLGDNPDAIYQGAIVRGDRRYRIRGNLSGAVYTSFTVEYGSAPGEMSQGVASVLNDSQFDADADGNYEILVSARNDEGVRNWLELPSNAVQISTRHYFERVTSAAADPSLEIRIAIEPLDDPAPPTWDDAQVATGIDRVVSQLRAKTSMTQMQGQTPMPSWVGQVPNRFPTPQAPGDIAYTALDASYTMAPYSLAADEALVMTGRFPRCRFSNVVLWNDYQVTYDYARRQVSRNRAQTTLESDGRYRMIIAHEDPGHPNWIDTEGRLEGTVFWRFFLPEEAPETPRTEVVKLAEIRARA